jgi:FkbM family methyltransferase
MKTEVLRSPRGKRAVLSARDQTTDLSVLGCFFAGVAGSPIDDEYGLADLYLRGRFVDVGAHIGGVTVAVLLDNPQATAILVEPVPENLKVITANLASNGLAGRCQVIAGAVGTDSVYYGFEGSEHLMSNRYIANITGVVHGKRPLSEHIAVRRVELDELLPCDVMKLDCEGGEYALFADPRITTVPYIFGEFHGDPDAGAEAVIAALGATHDVEIVKGEDQGNFRAVAK